ncbi:MAG: hypothetical protein K2I05_05765 [Mailhella sp.]|nr:hypothetical protein [Mailhella sp.]
MAYDSLSLSQPLHGGGYNEYLLNKMQNKDNPQSAIQQVKQNFSQQSLMDTVSGFASELRSQNLVKAVAAFQESNTDLPPTLKERGAKIDANGTVTMEGPIPKTEAMRGIALEQHSSLALDKKTGISLQGLRAMSLDSNSLGILSRLAKRAENQTKSPQHTDTAQSKTLSNTFADTLSVGKLAIKYESAETGSQSIGYDRHGGTSYGTYQLSSKAGTFDDFLTFLQKKEPEWADTLKKAGTANTGGRQGAVPAAWKKICAEHPERMKELEHDFIVESHYEPVLNYVRKKWNNTISPALKEVIFSTSVQHGVAGAKRIIDQALSRMPQEKANQAELEEKSNELFMAGFETGTSNPAQPQVKAEPQEQQALFIKNIYENRKNKFSSSTVAVQQAAKIRFKNEQNDALAMLG